MSPINLLPIYQDQHLINADKAREFRNKAQKLYEQQAYSYLKTDPYRVAKIKDSDFKGQVLKNVYA